MNQLEPSFTLLRRQFTDQSHFYVFAKNPVGLSPGVQISTSLIVGLKQGKGRIHLERAQIKTFFCLIQFC